ncbi:Stf0 family sulfotransferase [Rhodobium orientis]|uniref:Sulphotransferase Stf0 domain-containing protein n=1 Tax=Rhodobium orientis TaxID=34017 RepID=A0A327JK13_9HYPH|nr:hypothetical protein [Rhodobium orientis]RAI26669.1 hypothetical protein CH339_13050 [Rhodobium orientis]
MKCASTDLRARLSATIACFICATPRSGSNHLSTLLCQTHLAGYPEEHFWRCEKHNHEASWDASRLGDIVDRGTSTNGVFGTKLILGPMAFEHLYFKLQQAGVAKPGNNSRVDLTSVFSNVRYVHLSRRNKVRQAISWYRALCSNIWFRRSNVPETSNSINESYDFFKIDHLVQEIIQREIYFSDYCQRYCILPHTVFYEDLVLSPEVTISSILDFLSTRTDTHDFAISSILLPQSDFITEEWEQRYFNDRLPKKSVFNWIPESMN